MRWLARSLAAVAVLAWLGAAAAQMVGAPRLGELWFELDPFGLNLVQAVVQRYLHPGLWDHVAVPLLLTSSALVAGVVGAVCALLAWLVHPRG